jgi:hypothetical protein
VFCRNPHERFIRSETSVLIISDEGVVNGMDGKSTVSFGLQIKNGKRKKELLSNFENNFRPIFIYFDALTEGEGGGCSAGGSFSIVSQGQTLHAVAPASKVVSSCFVGSLQSQK